MYHINNIDSISPDSTRKKMAGCVFSVLHSHTRTANLAHKLVAQLKSRDFG